MRVNNIAIEVSVSQLLERDTVHALQGLSNTVLERFCEFLFRGFVHRGLYVAPPCDFAATRTGDGTVIGRFVWDRQFIAAALLAAQGEANLPLNRVSHDISSIQIDITTDIITHLRDVKG